VLFSVSSVDALAAVTFMGSSKAWAISARYAYGTAPNGRRGAISASVPTATRTDVSVVLNTVDGTPPTVRLPMRTLNTPAVAATPRCLSWNNTVDAES